MIDNSFKDSSYNSTIISYNYISMVIKKLLYYSVYIKLEIIITK